MRRPRPAGRLPARDRSAAVRHVIRRAILLASVALAACGPVASSPGPAAPKTGSVYLDATRSVEERVDDLLGRLTLAEKIQLLHADSKFSTAAIPRLGIPARQLSDGPHGVREEMGARNGRPAGRTDDFSTWLPVSVALAATWNPDLARQYGAVLGQEARARGKSVLLGPGVNIQRTPLGGRDFEFFSEDPFLAARMAVPWIKGIQSQDVAACVKHYALNNQEWERDTINVEVDERALREIYLPAFEAAVKEGGVWTIMGAYNQVRGQHACHNEYLLNTILKGEWGFRGIVISDWNGTHNTREAAFNGLDLEMGTERPYDEFYLARPLHNLVNRGLVPLSVVDDKVRRNLRVMFLSGAFDNRPEGAINTVAHQQTARRIAEEAMVLLKNDGGLLPIDIRRVRSIAVIGENATRRQAHGGGSSEIKPFYEVTPLAGILARAGANVNVVFSQGYRTRGQDPVLGSDPTLIDRAVAAAKQADVAIVVGGLNHNDFAETESKDRKNLDLPGGQAELIARVVEANPRTVVVLVSGAPVAMDPWLDKVPAVLQAWYAGMEGGNALAAILFGDVNPSGKLPCTFPRRLDDSPAHALGAYPGKEGTVRYTEGLLVGYRWFDAKAIAPLFPFGHGLSYTTFAYSNLRVTGGDQKPWSPVRVQVDVANLGQRAGSETIQVYVHDVESTQPRPPKELKGFQKIALDPGEKRTVEVPLGIEAFAFYDPARKAWIAEAGEFHILVGASAGDVRLEAPYQLVETQVLPR
jgi:beta-glucosidase